MNCITILYRLFGLAIHSFSFLRYSCVLQHDLMYLCAWPPLLSRLSCDTIFCIAIHVLLSTRIFSLADLAIQSCVLQDISFYVGISASERSCDTPSRVAIYFLIPCRFLSCDTIYCIVTVSSSRCTSAFLRHNGQYCDTLSAPFLALSSCDTVNGLPILLSLSLHLVFQHFSAAFLYKSLRYTSLY